MIKQLKKNAIFLFIILFLPLSSISTVQANDSIQSVADIDEFYLKYTQCNTVDISIN